MLEPSPIHVTATHSITMKTPFTKTFFPGLAVAALLVIGGQAGPGALAQTPGTLGPDATMAGSPAVAPVVSAAPAAAPVNIAPNSPLAQVIRLVQAGVSEDVILAYITNSSSAFNLDSDAIIYLSDLGAPGELATAMMQHDQQLQAQAATAQTEPAASAVSPPDQPVQPPVSVNYFYTSLAPYGVWLEIPGYGRCWRPTTELYNPGWQPYCDNGRWVYTDCGWCWVSDYAWGATFHYGRWFRDTRFGWCWWPDTTWGPSWVTWRYSDDYCGWAPLPPFTTFRDGGFYYRGAAVRAGFNFGLGVNLFTFVPTRNFCDPHPRHYRVDHDQVERIYGRSTAINDFHERDHRVINVGIAPGHITRVTHTAIREYPVRDLDRTHGFRRQADRDAIRTDERGHDNSWRSPGSSPTGSTETAPDRNRRAGSDHATVNGNPQSPAGHGSYYYTTPPRPVVPNNGHAQSTGPAAGPGAQSTGHPGWLQPQVPSQSRHLETPQNPVRNPRTWRNSETTTHPGWLTPPANYSAPAPVTPPAPPHNYNPPQNNFRAEPSHPSYFQRPAAPVQPRQNDQPRQGYSAPPARNDPPAAQAAPAQSQRSGGQNQNQNGQPRWQHH